jgi:hypothetical protein
VVPAFIPDAGDHVFPLAVVMTRSAGERALRAELAEVRAVNAD